MAELLSLEDLAGGHLDTQTLKEAVNEDKMIVSRLGAEFASVPMASRLLVENGLLGATPFSTYAAMTASALVDGDYAIVTNDDTEPNGIYQRDDGSWHYIKYNMLPHVYKNAYMLAGALTKLVSNDDGSYTISHGALRLYYGAGRGFIDINAATDLVIPANRMYYVDIAGASVGSVVDGLVSTEHISSYINGVGGFVEDFRIPLLGVISDFGVIGRLLESGKPSIKQTYYGDYLLAGKLTKADYNESDDTYTISHPQLRIIYGAGKAYNNIAAVTNLVIPAKSMYYVDIAGASAGATLTAQVTPTDFNSYINGVGGFVEDSKIPLFGFLAGVTGNRGLSVTGRLVQNGLPIATTASAPLDTVLVKKTSATAMSFYIKGTGNNHLKYGFNRTQVAFDGGTTGNSQSDLWRIEGVWEVDSNLADVYNDAIVSTGEWECAMRETGADVDTSDAIGGYHGDELQTNSFFVLDGKRVEQADIFTKSVKELQFVQESIIYRCNTQTPLCKHVKRYRITSKGGIELTQDFEWLRAATISRAWLTMLPIKRLINTTSGAQITDHATRYPRYELEDVSVDGFTEIVTDVSDGDSVIIWGDTSNISAEVVFDVVPTTQAQMYIDNPAAYNKIYLDVTGSDSEVNVSIGDKWLSQTTFRLNTAN